MNLGVTKFRAAVYNSITTKLCIMKTLRILTTALLVCILVFTSCERDDDFTQDNPDIPDDTGVVDDTETGNLDQFFGAEITRSFFGQVVDENNVGINDALVKVGGSMVTTDSNGIFSMENATVNESFGYLRVTAPGYVTGGRAVRPSDGVNRVKVMLLSADVTATVTSGVAETVQLGNGTSVSLPGAYIDENGNPYTGSVDVILDYLDPASEDLDALMPGMLYAEDAAGDEAYLETFGMISVELRDDSGNEINIDPNNPAELRFPLDPALQGVAPSTIPLWSFDDELGYWIEDGEAVLQGNEYVGMVSHFSFWNCDAPFPVVDFCITIQDADGNPLSGTTIGISVPITPYPRYGTTDENGEVCGKVAQGEVLNIFVEDLCGNTVYSTTAGPFTSAATVGPLQFTPTGSSTAQQVIGSLQDCSNVDVTNGYVTLEYAGTQFFQPVTNGDFEFNIISCPASDSFTFEGIDVVSQQSSGLISSTFTPPVTLLGAVPTCDAVSEYIEWTVDGTERFLTTPIQAGIDGDYLYISASSNTNDYFDISSSATTLGSYTWGQGMPGSMQMIMYETLFQDDVDSNLPINITFQLNAFGAVGDYIDITFVGTFTNTSGTVVDIDGSLHVIRDN